VLLLALRPEPRPKARNLPTRLLRARRRSSGEQDSTCRASALSALDAPNLMERRAQLGDVEARRVLPRVPSPGCLCFRAERRILPNEAGCGLLVAEGETRATAAVVSISFRVRPRHTSPARAKAAMTREGSYLSKTVGAVDPQESHPDEKEEARGRTRRVRRDRRGIRGAHLGLRQLKEGAGAAAAATSPLRSRIVIPL
jgi:hypothetical protein